METEEGGPRGRSGVGMLASQVARAAEDDEDGEVVTKVSFIIHLQRCGMLSR